MCDDLQTTSIYISTECRGVEYKYFTASRWFQFRTIKREAISAPVAEQMTRNVTRLSSARIFTAYHIRRGSSLSKPMCGRVRVRFSALRVHTYKFLCVN